jgi:nucleoid DNA-binding protein
MLVKIPMFPKAEDAKPLERCIEYASAKTGVDHYTAVLFLTHLLDQLADETTKGNVVSIPGFGLFAPVFMQRGKRPGAGADHVRPRFSPSQAYRNQVRVGCAPERAQTLRFRQHHDAQYGQPRARVFTAMENIRESISKQLGHARDPKRG